MELKSVIEPVLLSPNNGSIQVINTYARKLLNLHVDNTSYAMSLNEQVCSIHSIHYKLCIFNATFNIFSCF